MGLEAFTKKYDPYWDIPPNESLPKPVIDLPIQDTEGGLFGAESITKKGRMQKRKKSPEEE